MSQENQLTPSDSPPYLTCSALTGADIAEEAIGEELSVQMRTGCGVLQNREELTFGQSRWGHLLPPRYRFDICAESIVEGPET